MKTTLRQPDYTGPNMVDLDAYHRWWDEIEVRCYAVETDNENSLDTITHGEPLPPMPPVVAALVVSVEN